MLYCPACHSVFPNEFRRFRSAADLITALDAVLALPLPLPAPARDSR